MNKTTVGVGVVGLMAGSAALWVQHCDNAELRGEIALLRADVQMEARRAARASNGMAIERVSAAGDETARSIESAELAALRQEIGALRKSTQELTQLAQAAVAAKSMAGTESTVATDLVPANAWRNAGRGTPEAAAETLLWAALGGEVDTLSNALAFTPTARAKADAWFAGLSDGTRQQYGSPEKVIALMIAKDAATLSGMQMLGQKALGADDVGLRVRLASSEGKVKDDNLVMHRGSDGWRLMVPDNAVEKYARQLNGGR